MRFIIAIMTILLLTATACADSGTIKLDEFTYNITYNSRMNKVLMTQWNKDANISMFKICNPLDLEVEKLIVLDDFADEVTFIQESNCLLVFADKLNEKGHVKNTELRKVNLETGDVLAEIEIETSWNHMVIDNKQKYAFVYSGYEEGSLYKIDIEDFEVVADIMQFGSCRIMGITLDGNKLYISSGSDIIVPSPSFEESSDGMRYSHGPKQKFYSVSVYDTQDLTHLTDIMTIMSSSHLFILEDGRLVFLGYCYHEQDPSPDMMVVDTQTDEIVEILDFGESMIDEVTIDKRHNKIFATTNMKDLINSPFPEYPNYLDTGTVLEINLDDYSHRFIEVSDKPLVNIIAVPTDTGTRLFCMEKSEDEDADVFLRYYDVE
jgi:hypothetical protein